MFDHRQTSIATFGYRRAPVAQADDIVHAIDEMLQNSDAQPRRIHWAGDTIAMIDRIGVRIAVALLPASREDRYTHIVLAIGRSPENPAGDDLLNVSFVHLADRLIYRIKDGMPYDTIMRGETPDPVDHNLILSVYDLLRHAPVEPDTSALANLDSQPTAGQQRAAPPRFIEERFDVILSEEVPDTVPALPSWLEKRAVPTKPLRLTIHTMALSIMLYTAPLGAFLFTYSMLRDITDDR